MIRWVALGSGVALIAVSLIAFTKVVDTREGQIAEVVTLLAFGIGFVLLIYAFAVRQRPAPAPAVARDESQGGGTSVPRGSPRDLALGAAGVVVSAVLVTGLAVTGGLLWAGLGFVILLPMLAGSVYLCWRSLKTYP